MRILPEFLASQNIVLERLLEEFRLYIIEEIYRIYEKLNLFDLTNDEIAQKISLVGFNVESKDSTLFTPLFYKLFRRLNVHRSTILACNFIAKTGGFLETTSQYSTPLDRLLLSSLMRDYSLPYDSEDGYIYFDEKFKEYLSSQDLIYYYLPMGYSYVYITEMYPRNGGLTGSVLPWWWLIRSGRDYGYRSSQKDDSLWTRRSYIDYNGDEHIIDPWPYSIWYSGDSADDSLWWLFHIVGSVNDLPIGLSELDKSLYNVVINRDYIIYNQLYSDWIYLFNAFYFVSCDFGSDGLLVVREMGLEVSGLVPMNNVMSTYESLSLRGGSIQDLVLSRRKFIRDLFYNPRLEIDSSDIDRPRLGRVTSDQIIVDCFVERVPIVQDKSLYHLIDLESGSDESLSQVPLFESISPNADLPIDGRELDFVGIRLLDELSKYELAFQSDERLLVDAPSVMNIMNLIVEEIQYNYGTLSQSEGHNIPSGIINDLRARYTQSLAESQVVYGEMSTENNIIVGETTEVPLGTVGFKSKYYWAYQFNAGSISNPWQGQYYPEVPTSYSVNSTVPNTDVVNAYIGGKDSNDVVQTVIDVSAYPTMTYYIGQYVSGGVPLPEFYTSNAPATDIVIGKMGTLVEFTSNYTGVVNTEWDLPTDLFTINGTTVTWNISHIMYSLFYGKPVIAI